MSTINIIAKGLNGDGRVIAISQDASIKELKRRIKEAFNVTDDMRVLYINRDLTDVDAYGKEQFVKDYQMKHNDMVFIVYRLHGGSSPMV